MEHTVVIEKDRAFRLLVVSTPRCPETDTIKYVVAGDGISTRDLIKVKRSVLAAWKDWLGRVRLYKIPGRTVPTFKSSCVDLGSQIFTLTVAHVEEEWILLGAEDGYFDPAIWKSQRVALFGMQVEMFFTRVRRTFILLGAQGKRGNVAYPWEEPRIEDGSATIDDDATQDTES
ncbi:hypothetical protein EYR36_009955 [Pleurotus pulmonarius]|nr:hypothetical protein EYR36_009955 [Pleurotus pulmonarius]KAF4593432.1 hypothetical protein EYR38_009146 [Pleurotus pulmonarius]